MSGTFQAGETEYVYTGFWTNWSYGSLNGMTLTLSRKNGTVLIAFLALLITFTGGRNWKILRLLAHHYLSSERYEDALHHQRQALLRNTDSSSAALKQFLMLSWTWKKNVKISAFRRNSGILLLAFANTALFVTASFLSTKVANSMGDEVLISSPYCGHLQDSFTDANLRAVREYLNRKRRDLNVNYADSCYGNTTYGTSCNIYRKPRLPYTKTTNVPCPFPGQQNICQSLEGAIRLETGYINSNDDLGLNTDSDDRYSWRTVVVCSPLKIDGYQRVEIQQTGNTQHQMVSYLYGKSKQFGNATWQIPLEDPNIRSDTYKKRDYTVGIYSHRREANGSINDHKSMYWPIPELAVPDADGILAFLSSNDIPFLGQVNDPWFSSHKYAGKNTSQVGFESSINDKGLYFRDEQAQVLGCTQQWEICLPTQPRCTNLTSGEQSKSLGATFWQSESQREFFKWTHEYFSLIAAATWVGSHSLLAYKTLSPDFQGPLPDNQWELEMEQFFQQGLAAIQWNKIEQAAGYSDVKLRQLIISPRNDVEKDACRRQIVKSTAYTSFSVLGLSIILVICALIISMSFFLPILMKRTASFMGLQNVHKTLEWNTNSILQLQRLAHEAIGFGTWIRTDKEIPVTVKTQNLAPLDMSDSTHPRLKASQFEMR